MEKISIKNYDRRAEVIHTSTVLLYEELIASELKKMLIKTTVEIISDNGHVVVYRIGKRLLVKQLETLKKNLHKIAGLHYDCPKFKRAQEKKLQKEAKPILKKKNVMPEIISGFSGNLIVGNILYF